VRVGLVGPMMEWRKPAWRPIRSEGCTRGESGFDSSVAKEKNSVHKISEVTSKHEILVISVNKFNFVKR
jgi:hypothetical protein